MSTQGEAMNIISSSEAKVKDEPKEEKTFALFEHEDFEINQSDNGGEDYDVDDEEVDDEEVDDEEVDDEEVDDHEMDDEEVDDHEMDDEEVDDHEMDDLEMDDGEMDDGKGENAKEQKEDNIIIPMKERTKKKYINKKENIYFDNMGIYKNNKLMMNEDIEDRIKYLILLLTDHVKLKNNILINIDKIKIIKELLFYFSYYYEYSYDMIKYLYTLFDIKELFLFLEINNMSKDTYLRTNTLKITRCNLIKILKSKNISLEDNNDKWNDVGIRINDFNSNVGSLHEYLYGYYILQSSSSFIPVLALNANENRNDIILDMCAAPGGKCTFLCTIKKNYGLVYANDINKARCKAIEAHASRMGIHNLIITSFDSLKIHKYINFSFDKILLDAPCTGTGVVNKNKNARRKTLKEIRDLAQKQKILLNNAIDLVKNGGIVVYSTCSITVEENEQVINYILKKRDVNLVPININIGDPGITLYRKKQFSSKIALCKRIYLHKHNHDNFFIAKIVKRSDAILGKKLQNGHHSGKKQTSKRKKSGKNNVEEIPKKEGGRHDAADCAHLSTSAEGAELRSDTTQETGPNKKKLVKEGFKKGFKVVEKDVKKGSKKIFKKRFKKRFKKGFKKGFKKRFKKRFKGNSENASSKTADGKEQKFPNGNKHTHEEGITKNRDTHNSSRNESKKVKNKFSTKRGRKNRKEKRSEKETVGKHQK
ncbi:RNA methyltransferase, putative [Plasmodium ovale curtisi]|uniref:RNA methyltransferase, putative n=1 Tax=Plasmodium ovale curtisi TaxID=864141 RepID=A0A1A8WJH4_PLAOA|nr:RNA methyltransferase, putative [Plasmodium ovale curtisi]